MAMLHVPNAAFMSVHLPRPDRHHSDEHMGTQHWPAAAHRSTPATPCLVWSATSMRAPAQPPHSSSPHCECQAVPWDITAPSATDASCSDLAVIMGL
jgi:hypothetical protein